MPTHDISLQQARIKANNHRQVNPNATRYLYIPASEVRAILDQTGCETLVIHLALDDQNEPDSRGVILSGNNSQGERLSLLKDSAWPCPPNCAVQGLED